MSIDDGISPAEFEAAAGVGEWSVLGDGACSYFETRSLALGARLVEAIAAIPGMEAHAPDIDVRPDGVTVRLITVEDGAYGFSRRDVERARRISAAARGLGLSGDRSRVQGLLVIPGGPDRAAIRPFWQAVLGYKPRADEPETDLVDPRNRGTALWLERMQAPRADGGGAIHLAVWVPPEQAEARVAAALAAGGRLVRDDFAPSWWTLADAAGNECDVATTRERR
ncbi:MAG: VOC family protein [Dehalococcoidia bacterium]